MMQEQIVGLPLDGHLRSPFYKSKQRPAIVEWARTLVNQYPFDDNDAAVWEDASLSLEEEEQETMVVKELVQAVFKRKLAEPVLDRLIGEQPSTKKARIESTNAALASLSLSEPVHKTFVPPDTTTTTKTCTEDKKTAFAKVKADDFLRSLLESKGHTYKTYAALDMPEFFRQVTEESIEAYDMQVIQAVRDEDVSALRVLIRQGRTLQCCNKFGESIIHMACRRGSVDVVKFLLQEAGVSCRVCCDYGRTPLHDACWTSTPNFGVIDLLLDDCPDFLYMQDKRGFTPLAYIRPEQCKEWCEYLARRGVERLVPKELK